MATGIVKWFDAAKGYGFIVPDDGSHDVFVHMTAVRAAGFDGLRDGTVLSFEVEQTRSGKMAATQLQMM